MSKLPFPWIQEPWSVEGRSFWVLIRGARGRTHHLPSSKEKVCVTEAGFKRQDNCLQQIPVRTFICKIQMFSFIHLSHWNCSIMYKHPHICLYTYLLQTKRRVAWRLGLFLKQRKAESSLHSKNSRILTHTGTSPPHRSPCTLGCWAMLMLAGVISLNRTAKKSFKFN